MTRILVRANYSIRAKEVRVISQNGEQIGILPLREAVRKAEEAGLDLVEVAPTAKPPVCRIMDYGKYKYELSKKAHESKKHQTVIALKEVKFRPRIDEHDIQFKVNNARRFLQDGNKVKASVMFRGRERAHTSLGRLLLDRIAKDLEDVAVVEQHSRMEGNLMVMIFGAKAKG